MNINICHLYPDLLNLYGDRGNIFALKKRCEWRNIEINIHNISIGDKFAPEDYDIIFLGGGQDAEQEIIQKDVFSEKGKEIINAINNNKIFLCICGGYQLLGQYYKTWDNKEIKCLKAIDIYTIGGKKRLIGNVIYDCEILQNSKYDSKIIGFENHSGKTYLENKVKPLGKVIKGYGNNGEDGYEGAIYNNVYCTYSHGSLLPKNPAFTDHLLTTALKSKYPDFKELKEIDTNFEIKAHNSTITRFS